MADVADLALPMVLEAECVRFCLFVMSNAAVNCFAEAATVKWLTALLSYSSENWVKSLNCLEYF